MAAPEQRMVARVDLALLLNRCSDPLASVAVTSLGSSEAPESLPIWRFSRAALLATYEVRLARAEAGEGPKTNRIREYTEVLRDERTPEQLDELGWAVGDTFYVTLLHDGDVLAVSTVARAVWYLEDQVTHLDRGTTHQWVDVKTFGIGEGFNDQTLIKNTLDQPAYADDYLGTPPDEQPSGVHGPYRLAAVDFAAFGRVSANQARCLLQAWADQAGALSDAVQAALESNVFALLDVADDVYRFPLLREESIHGYGRVVGRTGFHEFIAIDPPRTVSTSSSPATTDRPTSRPLVRVEHPRTRLSAATRGEAHSAADLVSPPGVQDSAKVSRSWAFQCEGRRGRR